MGAQKTQHQFSWFSSPGFLFASGGCLFLFFCSLYVLTMGGHGYGGVGTTTYDVTRSIVLERDVAIAQVPWGKFGPDGRFYAQYGIGHSLYNLPFYLLGHGLTKIFPRLVSQYDRITMFCTLLGQPFISALTVVLLWKFCRKLGYTPHTSLLCALLYGLGTQVWMYAQLDFSEPLLAFCLLATAYWVYGITNVPSKQAIRQLLVAGVCFGFAVMVKIVVVIVLPLFLAYLWWASAYSKRWRLHRVGLFGLMMCLTGFVPVGWYNAARFGNPLETGYDKEFNFYWKHVIDQFWTNLVGLEGSIFLYSPVILLALLGVWHFLKRERSFAILVFGCITIFFLFYPFTTNELYYGPRYLTPTLPLFLLIAGAGFPKEARTFLKGVRHRWWIWLVGILLIFGILQQVVGVVVNYHTYYWRIQYTMPRVSADVRTSMEGQLLLKTPQLPHLSGHLWLLRRAIQDLFTPGGMPQNGIVLLADTTQHNAWIPYYGLDLWWCHPNLVQLMGWPGIGVIVAALLSMIGINGYLLVKIIPCNLGMKQTNTAAT